MASRDILIEYLGKVRTARQSGAGTPETSYYAALDFLLNAVGDDLRPRVYHVGQISADRGEQYPDGGLFTSHQIQHGSPVRGARPSRGAVEVKPPSLDLSDFWDPKTKAGEQVRRYLKQGYGGVFVTNLRDFGYVFADGTHQRSERSLASSETAFWRLAQSPALLDDEDAALVSDFLSLALRISVPITDPKELAQSLAVHARRARVSVRQADVRRLDTLRDELEHALGIEFVGARGNRFFVATVVQTIFYGLFSAWAMRIRLGGHDDEPFQWSRAGSFLRVPVLQELFDEVTKSSNVQALGLESHLDRAVDVLNRVQETELFSKFDGEAAIEYFYEPFLEAYDPVLREEFGVWYTPRPLIEAMVTRVDDVLRSELGIEDGLADPTVVVLDPACGTGGFLTAVLDHIAARLRGQGQTASEVQQALRFAATRRIVGFEILTAPYAVAHLILNLHLKELGAQLADGERPAIYLTNALTGGDAQETIDFHIKALGDESVAAERIKRSTPVLVVLGNPPYDAYADIALTEEAGLVDRYRKARRTATPKGHGLNDLYVRFFAMAERAIVERGRGFGVVSFVSNSSWLDGLSHTGMRERYLDTFSKIWIDNLHGDKYRTGKRIPASERGAGLPDPSVFSLGGNNEGIQVGTAIATLFRSPSASPVDGDAEVYHRSLWGTDKLVELSETAASGSQRYTTLSPDEALGLPFVPSAMNASYTSWPRVPDLFPFYTAGIKTSRDQLLVDTAQDVLVDRIEIYFDPNVSDGEMATLCARALESTNTFDAARTRRELVARGMDPGRIIPHVYRPFDLRWLFYEPESDLVERKRPEYLPQVFGSNRWLATSQRSRKGYEPPIVAESTMSLHVSEWSASCFPLYTVAGGDLFGGEGDGEPPALNLSPQATAMAREASVEDASVIFYHALAIMHAQAYQGENAGALMLDWPRLPVHRETVALLHSGDLGRRVADLVDVEREVQGVTRGRIDPHLRPIAVLQGDGVGTSNSFTVKARWGRSGKDGAVMPGQGMAVARRITDEEADAMGSAAALLCGPERLTYDVHLNAGTKWSNVPAEVWDYRMGGYQVLKKWLSYRETSVLGRELDESEAVHFCHSARRIAALLLMREDLDDNYAAAVAADSILSPELAE